MRFVSEPHADTLLYGAIHLVLREVIAARTLDGLVEAREDLSADQLARAVGALPDVGIRLSAAWVKDVILPGEVKDLVARVTMARKDAEANAIRRREEVASTRQLANTAKLLEGNPILLRLKELEALGELVGKIDKLVVVGGGDLARHVMLRSTEL
jgi:regulator of protease activity HflC (stomatin/prohibitin superfamily)